MCWQKKWYFIVLYISLFSDVLPKWDSVIGIVKMHVVRLRCTFTVHSLLGLAVLRYCCSHTKIEKWEMWRSVQQFVSHDLNPVHVWTPQMSGFCSRYFTAYSLGVPTAILSRAVSTIEAISWQCGQIRNKWESLLWSSLLLGFPCSTGDKVMQGLRSSNSVVSVPPGKRCFSSSAAWLLIPALCVKYISNFNKRGHRQCSLQMASVRLCVHFNASSSVRMVNFWPLQYGRSNKGAPTLDKHSWCVSYDSLLLTSSVPSTNI